MRIHVAGCMEQGLVFLAWGRHARTDDGQDIGEGWRHSFWSPLRCGCLAEVWPDHCSKAEQVFHLHRVILSSWEPELFVAYLVLMLFWRCPPWVSDLRTTRQWVLLVLLHKSQRSLQLDVIWVHPQGVPAASTVDLAWFPVCQLLLLLWCQWVGLFLPSQA